ncbi:Outer membrane protein OmpA [Streptosporangium subroseum]|uniref:Outer membrane protein OmpA n=1 Tax=Streptosporangium subroseum TaxID=106412 RepID=A0A239NM94_9ACTN|nr:OmpA family protein [Streptosporangium subroseum]SNT56021.1 Outer membrane protein OmpA [Streptosporangium subroseum]
MSRSPERTAAILVTVALMVGSGQTARADPTSPPGTAPVDAAFTVEDLVFPVEDIVPETESMDGTESESKRGEEITVGLTSDVLFALDRAVLTPQARQRLQRVVAKVRAESVGGAVRIEGHTDDQGSDAYNDALSLKRAQAVRQALQGKLPDVTLQASGYGERRPKLPNIVQGKPVKENRARNRRVEIVFNAKQ